jgi:hypothetical protein
VSEAAAERYVEMCLRCGAGMEWRHGTFQCPRCRFKIGCCEGETAECRDEPTVRPPSGDTSVSKSA